MNLSKIQSCILQFDFAYNLSIVKPQKMNFEVIFISACLQSPESIKLIHIGEICYVEAFAILSIFNILEELLLSLLIDIEVVFFVHSFSYVYKAI